MSRAGYDIGQELGKMMQHVFVSKLANAIAKIGQIVGIILLAGGLLVLIFDYGMALFGGKLILPGFLISVGGVLFLCLLHGIALLIDKKHHKKS